MQTQGRTPFISPLEPISQPAPKVAQTRLNLLVIMLMVVFLMCMGLFAYQATQPSKARKATTSNQQTQEALSEKEITDK